MSEQDATPPTPSAPPTPTPDAGVMVPENDEAKTMGMLCHLLGIIGFLGPLILWLLKKDTSPYVDAQGKEALNFHITLLLAIVPTFIISSILPPLALFLSLLTMLVILAGLAFVIIATLKASAGQGYAYPFALRLIK
ncbi:MAG: DUF4870 domain-containing protein [Planctomycetota bacterium]